MDHPKFEQGEYLFDSLHCRTVQIVTEPGTGDLSPACAFVEATDSEESYTVDKSYLYSRDEVSAALAHQDIDEILEEMRKDRLLEEAPLLQYVEFSPDEITKDVVIDLQNIEVEVSRIDKHLRRKLTKAYFSGELESTNPKDILEYACAILIKESK